MKTNSVRHLQQTFFVTRTKIPQQFQFPYGIGGRCINREWFGMPMEDVWTIMSEQLYFIHHAFHVEILAFVLMTNHFHLIVRTPRSNLSEAMAYFMRETSRAIVKSSGRINQTWGQRHFRSVIGSTHYYLHAYKYFYRNPVKAGLCRRVEDYRFSTLRGLIGLEHLLIPVQEDVTLFSDVEGTLKWLNRKPDLAAWESVRKALRRSEFKLGKVVGTNSKNPMEINLL